MRVQPLRKSISILLFGLSIGWVNLFLIDTGLAADPAVKTQVISPRTISIDVLSAEPSKEQQELLVGLNQALRAHQLKLETQHIYWNKQQNWQSLLEQSTSELIISIGDEAWDKLKQQTAIEHKNKLGFFVSTDKLEQLRTLKTPNDYAISHEQPLERYFYLAKSLDMPAAQIGTLFNLKHKSRRLAVDDFSTQLSLNFKPLLLDRNLDLARLVKDLQICCDLFIYNRKQSLINSFDRKSIFMNAYRNRILVIGNSVNSLKEGAMLALYTAPYQLAEQAATLIANTIQVDESSENDFKEIVPFQYPKDFSIDSNSLIEQAFGIKDLSLGSLSINIKKYEHEYSKNSAIKKEYYKEYQAQGNLNE